MKTTQITGFNGISVDDISTAALKDIQLSLSVKLTQVRKELECVEKELKKRGV